MCKHHSPWQVPFVSVGAVNSPQIDPLLHLGMMNRCTAAWQLHSSLQLLLLVHHCSVLYVLPTSCSCACALPTFPSLCFAWPC